MKFVDAKCPNCGAVLKVDDSKEAAICEHCGSAFIVEKAIQQFNITNVTNNNINAQTVNIIAKEKDFVIEAGVLVKYKGESPIVHVPGNVESIKSDALPTSIRELYLPDSLEELNRYVCGGFSRLTKVVFGKNLKTIGEYAFENCKELREIKFNEKLEYIGKCAFFGSGLKELILPASLKKVENSAFANCADLLKVFIPKQIESVGSNVFGDNASNAKYRYCSIHCQFKKPLLGPPKGWARDWAGAYASPNWGSTMEMYEWDDHC